MNISEPFIRRPVATTLLSIALLLFGALAYRSLPISDLPNVDFPTIEVSASLPGASPETMASSVATPLERQFATIAGIDSMSSTSGMGSTSLTLQFSLDRDIDAAAQDVQTAIARASRALPSEMPSPPSYRKVNPADQPILYLALTSPTMEVSELDELGQTMLAQRISTVSGVAQVNVFGSQKYAVRVQLDPRALISRGIGIDEVARAVTESNVNLPTGMLYDAARSFTLRTSGQLLNAEEYQRIIVAYRDGHPVQLDQLGKIFDGVENDRTAAWYIDKERWWRSVILAIQKQPGTNTVAIADRIRDLLPQFQTLIPPTAELRILNDRSQSIRESVHDVKLTLLLTVVLVVLVIFLFLRNLRATLIPSIAVPMSIVGTFAAMYVLGFSLNNLSLMALTLSVGFVVDDAIVMLENIVRYLEKGDEPLTAALRGAKEITFTIVSMTISLAAVFIPVLFMSGIVGRLFNEFAVTIAIAILISGIVSLTLTPMLARFFLKHSSETRSHGIAGAIERGFDRSVALYGKTLDWSFRHRGGILIGSFVLLVVTGWLFVRIPKGFLPLEDQSQVFGSIEGPQGISFEGMREKQDEIAKIVRNHPAVSRFFSSVGARGGAAGATNQGTVFVRLKERSERAHSVNEVIADLRKDLSKVTGVRIFLQNPPPIRLGGQLTRALYQLTLQGVSTEELYEVAPKLEEAMRSIPGITDVTSNLELKNPEVFIELNRERARSLQLTPRSIQEALYFAYGSRQVSTIYAPHNDYRVIMELLPEFRRGPDSLPLLYVRATDGNLVPLSAVATLREQVGPLSINHLGQLPAVTLSFNLVPGTSLSEAVERIRVPLEEIVPSTITASFEGTAQAFQSSLQSMNALLVVAVLVIYIVLGVLYESFIHPLTILTALPFAGLGAFVTLLAFGRDLDIYGFVGVIMLIGIVKKNGIMMIDFAIEAKRRGERDPQKAIRDACLIRFRPIMMTTMAALLGTLPLAVGYGAGAEARQPLGLAVVGGLLFSQILTLYVTPVFYLWMERLSGESGSGVEVSPR